MVLESCMILVDNSEFMRNGDYIPSRLEAQHDAANLLVSHKTQSNPESTVGVIALCGSDGSGSAELLVSPTDDMGKILGALHGIPIRGGAYDVCASVQVASLALKHRRNKNGAQRVVLFVGSPLVEVDKRALVKAGKLLKKNNVSIDVISMGEDNEERLKDLVDAANGTTTDGEERTCHLVTIPPGVLPSDVLITSPIVRGAGGGVASSGAGAMDLSSGGGGGGGADAFAEYGGVDPNMDPELAMALRVSMEEERARQERLAQAAAEAAAAEGGEEESKTETAMEVEETKEAPPVEATATAVVEEEMGDEDALLQQALAMSMAEQHTTTATTEEAEIEKTTTTTNPPPENDEEEDDEDAAMQIALQMSMATETEPSSSQQQQDQFQDPQFVNQLLGSLPGVNPNDPAIQNALSNLQRNNNNNDEEKDNNKEEEKK